MRERAPEKKEAVMVSGKVLSQNRYKISGTVNHKTFTADHVRLLVPSTGEI